MISTSDDIRVVYPAYLSGAHEFTSGLQWGSCCSDVSLLCVSLTLVACRFVLFLLAIVVVRKDMDVNEHKRLFNNTLQRNSTTSIVLNPRGFRKVSISVLDNEQKLQCTAVNHGKSNMILACKLFNASTNILQCLLRTRNSQSSRTFGCTPVFAEFRVTHLLVVCDVLRCCFVCVCLFIFDYYHKVNTSAGGHISSPGYHPPRGECFVYILLPSLDKYLCWQTYQSPRVSSTQRSVLCLFSITIIR